jgi:hypothetical protein
MLINIFLRLGLVLSLSLSLGLGVWQTSPFWSGEKRLS